MKAVGKLRHSARPVLFETGLTLYPHSICGTAFLVEYRSSIFAITARHVVRSHPAEKLHIRPSDKSTTSIPFSRWFVLPLNEDHDLSDLYVIRVDANRMHRADKKALNILYIPAHGHDWFSARASSRFFFFGYPVESAEVDAKRDTVLTQQYIVAASYVGPSLEQECFELSFDNPLGLTDLSGMSGSPVIAMRSALFSEDLPVFAGMILRGSVSSGRVHFLSSSRIVEALRSIDERYAAY